MTENIKFFFSSHENRCTHAPAHSRTRYTHTLLKHTHTHTHTQTRTHTQDTVRDGTTRRTAVLARGEHVWKRRGGHGIRSRTVRLDGARVCARALARVLPLAPSGSGRTPAVAAAAVGGGDRDDDSYEFCVISSPPPVAPGRGGGRHRARTAFRSFSIPLGLAAGRRPMGRRPPQWLTTAAAAAFTLFLLQ